MLLVTFHGGSKGKDNPHPVYQVYCYDEKNPAAGGKAFLRDLIPPGPNGFRDLQLLPFGPQGQFYLANSYKKGASAVYQITPTTNSVTAFVNGVGGGDGALCSVYHPFAFAFDDAMEVCYVSCQNSNVVVSVGGPNSKAVTPGQPLPVNDSLPAPSEGTAYLPGTFVASQVPLLPDACPEGTPTPPALTSEQGGLNASQKSGDDLKPDDTPDHSVRGVAVSGPILYVADEVDDCIRMYDTITGDYIGKIDDQNDLVRSPTHLLTCPPGSALCTGQLLISVNPSKKADAMVLMYDPYAEVTLAPAIITQQVDVGSDASPAGMTFDSSGIFYLLDRQEKSVYRFNAPNFNPMDGGKPFIEGMVDNPEFILWVDDSWFAC